MNLKARLSAEASKEAALQEPFEEREIRPLSSFIRSRFTFLDGIPPPRHVAYSKYARGPWWERWERMTGVPVPSVLRHVVVQDHGKGVKARRKKPESRSLLYQQSLAYRKTGGK